MTRITQGEVWGAWLDVLASFTEEDHRLWALETPHWGYVRFEGLQKFMGRLSEMEPGRSDGIREAWKRCQPRFRALAKKAGVGDAPWRIETVHGVYIHREFAKAFMIELLREVEDEN